MDSAFIKANAKSADSLIEKQVVADAPAYLDELNKNSGLSGNEPKKLVERHHNWKKEAYKGMPGNNKTVKNRRKRQRHSA
ncbi:MAG: hypothetical protein R3A43_03290 [Bacteroidia bacterium]